MLFKKLFAFSLILFFSTSLLASDRDIQKERFINHINELEKAFINSKGKRNSLDDVVKKMLSGARRVAAFNLQALGKVYSSYKPENTHNRVFFRNTIRFEFKLIEDAIGEVKQHMEYLGKTKKEKKIIKHQRNKAAAIELLKYVLTGDKDFLDGKVLENYKKPKGKKVKVSDNLTHEGEQIVKKFKALSDKSNKDRSLFWNKSWFPHKSQSKLSLLSQALTDYPWSSYKEDRAFLLSQLSLHLDTIADDTSLIPTKEGSILFKNYDLNLLENGENGEKGLHEYRRELRWFSFQAGVLNGLMGTDNSCPINDYKDIVLREDLIKSRYTKFPKTPFPDKENVCYISKCLYYKLADVISLIGDLKDNSKVYNSEKDIDDNITPRQYAKEAEDIALGVTKNRLLQTMSEQINSCI